VQVSKTVKDYWGIPVARISGFKMDEDIKNARFISAKAEEWLKAAGAAGMAKHTRDRRKRQSAPVRDLQYG
jgi:hypothetical protein